MFCKTLIFFFVLFLLSDSLDGQRDKKKFRNDYTYIDAVESFYKFHAKNVNWFHAKQVCAQEGASLFYPENDDEAHAVLSFWKSTHPDENCVFVGMTDLLALGKYETIDGKAISEVYHSWSNVKVLHTHGTPRCIVLFHRDSGIFVDYCTGLRPFICKKSLQSLQWNYCCDIYDLDYTFKKDTGSCHKLHTTPLNWTDAYAACRTEQSYLAVIDNQLEADYLVDSMESASKQRVEGNYFRGIFHVGFHNLTHEGWRTVKGIPMHEDGNGWWGNNQPEGRDQCGSMFSNGRLGNINCDTKSFFICEHDVGNSNISLLETNNF